MVIDLQGLRCVQRTVSHHRVRGLLGLDLGTKKPFGQRVVLV